MKIKHKLLLKPRIFKPSFEDWKIDGVFNPAAVRLPNNKIMLMVRVAESQKDKKRKKMLCPVIVSKSKDKNVSGIFRRRNIVDQEGNIIYFEDGICGLPNISHFKKVILDKSGFKIEVISRAHDFTGRAENSEYGVEDPRIIKIGDFYFMTYVAVSARTGISTSLAVSKDLVKWKRKGIIFQEQNKDVVLFPEKISGMYVALNRPESSFIFSKPDIWISYSPDLTYWGKEKPLLRTRENSWESERNGAGPPPIKTKHGWLLIYHGVNNKRNRNIYSAGAALLNIKNPEKIIARSLPNSPLLKPKKELKKLRLGGGVIFPTGAVLTLDKKSLLIYSGVSDKEVSVKEISLKDIISSMGPC